MIIFLDFDGVLHPTVLANFDLAWPVSVVEINVEPFL